MKKNLFCWHMQSFQSVSAHCLLLRYRVGEAFLHVPLVKAQKLLTRDQESLNTETEKVRESAEDCEKTMKELKVALYAKFGKAINLDV